MKDSFELLLPIFAAMDRTIKISSVDDLTGGTYRINSCNTKWAIIGRTLTIAAIDYLITDLVPNESITVTGTSIPVVASFSIYAPNVFRNTAREQDLLLALIDQKGTWVDKIPMIWVHTITREVLDSTYDSSLGLEADYDIYFLAGYDPEGGLLTEDHYRYAVTPMRNMLEAFIKATVKSRTTFSEEFKYQQYDQVKLSLKADKTQSPTNDFLSGTQFKGTITFYRENCKNCN